MYSVTDKSYFQAKAIKLGQHKLDHIHHEIIDWVSLQFSIKALDFICETRETSKGLRQQIIHIILDTPDDVKSIQSDRANIEVVAGHFLKHLILEDRQSWEKDPLKSNVFPADTSPFPEIIITFRPLKEIGEKVLQEMSDEEQRMKLKTYPEVWTISMNVVFFYTDWQVKESRANGLADQISKALVEIRNKYDFEVSKNDIKPFRFDSKEIFDHDYSSNWYYYWK